MEEALGCGWVVGVGDRTVDETLTIGRQEISSTAALKLQELCDQYEIGIKVVQAVNENCKVYGVSG